ncbi:MAG: hypothetical protein IPK93_02675 [Solirubrobacterales bacterium]|nr:hypothetical protein [Solirubrobacterales bacterium]
MNRLRFRFRLIVAPDFVETEGPPRVEVALPSRSFTEVRAAPTSDADAELLAIENASTATKAVPTQSNTRFIVFFPISIVVVGDQS